MCALYTIPLLCRGYFYKLKIKHISVTFPALLLKDDLKYFQIGLVTCVFKAVKLFYLVVEYFKCLPINNNVYLLQMCVYCIFMFTLV